MARGEHWAGNALYDRVHVVVDRTLRRVLRHAVAERDEFVQGVFEHLVVALTERRLPESCNLTTWANVVSTRAAVNWLRRDAGQRVECLTAVAQAHRALARLAPACAEAVVLHDVLGHDLSEIAATTEVAVAKVQSRLVQGRKALRGCRQLAVLRDGPVVLLSRANAETRRSSLLPPLQRLVVATPQRLRRRRLSLRGLLGLGFITIVALAVALPSALP